MAVKTRRGKGYTSDRSESGFRTTTVNFMGYKINRFATGDYKFVGVSKTGRVIGPNFRTVSEAKKFIIAREAKAGNRRVRARRK